LFLVVAAALAASACSTPDPKNPGIDLGAPNVRWADKTKEQRFGFMAGRVEPMMKQLFIANDSSYSDFGCATCHGANMDLVDYKMPADIYPLPEEETISESMDYDEEVTQFMMKKVVPATKDLFNRGHGTETKVSCFTCHPTE
jgi:hypothetical protein